MTQLLKSFSTNVQLLYHLKTSENLRFCDVFKGYRSGTLVENGLIWTYWVNGVAIFIQIISLKITAHDISFFFENTTIYRYLFRSGVFLVNFEHISHTIVDFEQVNAGWECSRNFCYCHWQIFQTNFHKKNLEFWGSNVTGNIGPLIFWSWYETLLFISVQVFLFIKIGCRIIKRWLFQKNVWVYFSIFIGICYIR